LITLIIVVGEWRYGAMGGAEKLLITLGTCVATEIALSLFILRRFPSVQSAYISGMSLTLLVRPTDGIWWPFAVGAFLSIASKYVLRYRGKHLWNPSNLGLSLLVLLAPNKVALLSHELGNDVLANVVIWTVGLMVASRARVLHITVTYALSFIALALLRSVIVGTPALAELAPITGPMYQLLVFFMMTDPPTTVSTKRGRIMIAMLIAGLECVFRLANDFEWPGAEIVAPAPAILALFVVGPIALAIDLKRRSNS
jgi:enediyne biosynthesis protein E5